VETRGLSEAVKDLNEEERVRNQNCKITRYSDSKNVTVESKDSTDCNQNKQNTSKEIHDSNEFIEIRKRPSQPLLKQMIYMVLILIMN